jgi:hypothetical protein
MYDWTAVILVASCGRHHRQFASSNLIKYTTNVAFLNSANWSILNQAFIEYREERRRRRRHHGIEGKQWTSGSQGADSTFINGLD